MSRTTGTAGGRSGYLDSELYLYAPDEARFTCSGREHLGRPRLDAATLTRLRELELDAAAYGAALFDAALPPASALREGYREAVAAAERERRRLRLRLHLGARLDRRLHALYWELLYDAERGTALARSPETAFSRYSTVPRELGRPGSGPRKLLCVVAAPSDASRFGLATLDRTRLRHRLAAALQPAARPGIEFEMLAPPATPGRLRQRLVEGDFQGLYILGHGVVERRGDAHLVLEDDDGTARFVDEGLLSDIFLGDRDLRLVVLMACHGGDLSSADPFSGLARRLVERGLPAVIGMRRAVTLETAYRFTEHLVRHLDRTGLVDVAVNEARHQLHLGDPKGTAWSSPVLFMRLEEGRVWPQAEDGEPATAAAGGRLAPVPAKAAWLPALALALLLALGRWPLAEARAELDLRASRVALEVAETGELLTSLGLRELAVTRLAAVDPPSATGWRAGRLGAGDGPLGLIVAPAGDGPATLTLHLPVLAAGTRLVVDHFDALDYRLALEPSSGPLRVGLAGDLAVKPLHRPAARLELAEAGSLRLIPRPEAVDLDLVLAAAAAGEPAPAARIDGLELVRVVESVDPEDPERTDVRIESTLLEGRVTLPAARREHRLAAGERLGLAALDAVVDRFELTADGIRLHLRGSAGGLTRTAAGGRTENLMPQVLDLWLPEGVQAAAIAASVLLTLLVLLAALSGRVGRRRRPLPPGRGDETDPSISLRGRLRRRPTVSSNDSSLGGDRHVA